ncbi:hypothetical protein Ndes2526B_g08945 [Nannochloris sp. 'desiccata']|nr:hypothetical protein KSW81_001500 [Chlorella desiccata (nom. nud.)]KAH7616835.1 putative Protein arginine N-methyltransferase PRMT10 [Chlorella desiccata (nom. nud.)]
MGRNGATGSRVSNLDGEAPESTDFANYFCTYAYIYHQKDMLEDHKRTGAYYQACMQNRGQFANKVVLDVGTGSGILAIFAAKAGAKKVYAVEATSMAINAKRMVEAQGLEGVIEVIQGVIESVEIPEKVDIIISEWMGYFLLRESMLDSVVVARDRFLKPDGALYPSHARLFMAPIRTQIAAQRTADFQNSMHGWGEFIEDMREMYGVEMDCLSADYRKEQKEYYSQTSAWTDIHPSQMVGPPALIKAYDLKTVTLEELKAPLNANFTMSVTERGSVDAYCGFFDTEFKGSTENPADFPITLSTAPDPTGATHWGQQSFFLQPSLQVAAGDKIVCELQMRRRKENHRLLEVHLKHTIENKDATKGSVVKAPERVSHFIIE